MSCLNMPIIDLLSRAINDFAALMARTTCRPVALSDGMLGCLG
jgi:hypothetical protein